MEPSDRRTNPTNPTPPSRLGRRWWRANGLMMGVFVGGFVLGVAATAAGAYLIVRGWTVGLPGRESAALRRNAAATSRTVKGPSREDFEQPVGPAAKKPLTTYVNSLGMKFLIVPRRRFTMGSPATEQFRGEDEPQKDVDVAEFFLLATEVSQAQWNRVMGANTNPSIRQGSPNLPVENVSWADAVRFCERLSAMEGRRYRLPSEAEWECAARAGSTGPWPFPEADIKAGKCFNFYDRSCTEDMPFPRDGNDGVDHTADIGTYQPNAWGFYDMLGNVWEWTSTPTIPDDPNDIVNSTWNAHRKVSDAAPGEPIYYVLRGGSYLMPHWVCRSANRYGRPATVREVGADIGFRVAMDR